MYGSKIYKCSNSCNQKGANLIMIREERLSRILEILTKNKFASVEDLSKTLYVSEPTIRRDLAELTRRKAIIRSHGGAMPIPENNTVIPIDFRNGIDPKGKLLLAKEAAKMVKDGDVIYIDASTTTLRIVDFVRERKNIIVITNSMQVAHLLRKYNITGYCTGGMLIENSLAFAGSYAEATVSNFNIDIMFFSTSAVTHTGYIADYSEMETNLRRVAMKNARKKVYLCDKEKFEKSSVFHVAHLNDMDCIITNDNLPKYPCNITANVIIVKE